MGRIYYATGQTAAVTTADEILQIKAPSDAVVVLHAVKLLNETNETSEMAAVSLSRAGSDGSGGSAVTARPAEVGDAAYGGTILEQNSSEATSLTEICRLADNILAGFVWEWTPESRPVLSPSGTVVLKTLTTIASTTFTYEVILEEIGG